MPSPSKRRLSSARPASTAAPSVWSRRASGAQPAEVLTQVAAMAAGAPRESALMMYLLLEMTTLAKGLVMIFVGDLSLSGLSPLSPLSMATSVKALVIQYNAPPSP